MRQKAFMPHLAMRMFAYRMVEKRLFCCLTSLLFLAMCLSNDEQVFSHGDDPCPSGMPLIAMRREIDLLNRYSLTAIIKAMLKFLLSLTTK